MSYKYSKGAQVIGDLKAQDDAQRDTIIDFGEDVIDFQTSGSSVLKISGSDVYLADGSHLYLSTNSNLYFDATPGTPSLFMSEQSNNSNSILMDANNRLTIRVDEYFFIQDENNNDRVSVDFRTNDGTATQHIRTDLVVSSSQDISASALHLQDGITNAGETIFNDQGNIVNTPATAVITIADNPSTNDTISFSDSTITPVVVSTYKTRGLGDNDILRGGTAAATRENTRDKLEELYNVSVTINGNDLEITNNNAGAISNVTLSETFTSANNSISGFTGGYSIDIFAHEITASSFSSPDGTLIDISGNFQGNDASFNEITASSNLSFSGDLFLNNTEKLIDSQGDHALLQTMVVELSIPGTDVQTDSSAFRFFCPYDLTVDELQLNLDENNSGEAVTVQISGSQGFTQSLTLTGPTDNGTTGSLDGSLQAGELLNFEITSVSGTPQGLIANLLYRRTLP